MMKRAQATLLSGALALIVGAPTLHAQDAATEEMGTETANQTRVDGTVSSVEATDDGVSVDVSTAEGEEESYDVSNSTLEQSGVQANDLAEGDQVTLYLRDGSVYWVEKAAAGGTTGTEGTETQ